MTDNQAGNIENHKPGVTPGDPGETGSFTQEPLPLRIHHRIQAGDNGTGQILHHSEGGRFYVTCVEGINSELEEMMVYLEAGERFLHGTRTYQACQA